MDAKEFKNMITFEGEDMKVFRGYQIIEAIEELLKRKKKLEGSIILDGKRARDGKTITDYDVINKFYTLFMAEKKIKIMKKGRKKLVKNCRILQEDRRYYLAFGGEDGYTLEPRRFRVNQGDEKKIREKLDKICNVMNQVNDWNHEHEDANIPEEIWDCVRRFNKACDKYQEIKHKYDC